MNLNNLPELLHRKLASRKLDSAERDRAGAPEPIDPSHREMAPQYAYGRHRGPAPRNAYRAAVVIGLVPISGDDWAIPLTLRPINMSDHGGQVSLPGGRAEPSETVWRTACREFGEELGCSTEYLQPVGELAPLYVYASKYRVSVTVGTFSIRPSFRPNPEEVAELLFLPVHDLIDDEAITVGTLQRGTMSFDAPGFRIGKHFVWGATAMILGDFRTLMRSIVEDQSSEPWFM